MNTNNAKLKMKLILNIVFVLFLGNCNSQNFELFNNLATIGLDNSSKLQGLAVDSQYIYVIGDELIKRDSFETIVKPQTSVFDYRGNMLRSDPLIFPKKYLQVFSGNHQNLIKLNDSIYYVEFYTTISSMQYIGTSHMVKLNLRSGQVLENKQIYNWGVSAVSYAPLKIQDSKMVKAYQVNDTLGQIVELDLDLNIIKKLDIPLNKEYFSAIHLCEKNEKGEYELVGNSLKFDDKMQLAVDYLMFYLKIDSTGKLLKRREYQPTKLFGVMSGQMYTVQRETQSRDIIMTCFERIYLKNNIAELKPHTVRLSSEFDSLRWDTRMYEYIYSADSITYLINHQTILNDGSGVVAVGQMNSSRYSLPDYGFMYKVSMDGDSLWFRKYQPLGWDLLQSAWLSLRHAESTPYNTIAICGVASDRINEKLRSWLLQTDTHGCIIPGCEKIVSTKDIQEGKARAFELYPNPVINDRIYLISRVSTEDKARISIIDLQGKLIKSMSLQLEEGVQYLIDLPQEIQAGEYIFRIESKAHLLNEKIVVN